MLDEALKNLITGDYYDINGVKIAGAYNTIDPSAAIIDVFVLEKLLNVAAPKVKLKKSEYTWAVIIKAVLQGLTKQDIKDSLGYCRSTINKVIRGLDKQSFDHIWDSYRDTVLADIDVVTAREFIACGCDYKKWLVFKDNDTLQKIVDIRRRAKEDADFFELYGMMVEEMLEPVEGLF